MPDYKRSRREDGTESRKQLKNGRKEKKRRSCWSVGEKRVSSDEVRKWVTILRNNPLLLLLLLQWGSGLSRFLDARPFPALGEDVCVRVRFYVYNNGNSRFQKRRRSTATTTKKKKREEEIVFLTRMKNVTWKYHFLKDSNARKKRSGAHLSLSFFHDSRSHSQNSYLSHFARNKK